MDKIEVPKTIIEAIIMAIEKRHDKKATLAQLYASVPELLGREVKTEIIRSVINRSLVSRNKAGPYPVLFVRVSPETYALAKTTKVK